MFIEKVPGGSGGTGPVGQGSPGSHSAKVVFVIVAGEGAEAARAAVGTVGFAVGRNETAAAGDSACCWRSRRPSNNSANGLLMDLFPAFGDLREVVSDAHFLIAFFGS